MQYEKRTANHTMSTSDSAALNRKLIIVSLSVVAKIYCLGVVIIWVSVTEDNSIRDNVNSYF